MHVLAGASCASEVTTVWRYRNLIIIIIISAESNLVISSGS